MSDALRNGIMGAAAMLLGIWLLSLLQARRTKPSPTRKQRYDIL